MSSPMDHHEVFEIKVTLCHVSPPVWRRFLVPKATPLDRLHDILQIVMGWKDMHLHLFEIDGHLFSENPEDPKTEGVEESQHALSELCSEPGDRLRYLYDFGDRWEHDVVIEGTRRVDHRCAPLIQCTAGEGVCPPEDFGGPMAYNNEPATMSRARPNFPSDHELFLVDEVNDELAKYSRWSRNRTTP